jgi:disulfide bond formation protein DsbB
MVSGNPRPLLHHLNTLGLLGVGGVLAAAFAMQILLSELPCPLCLLQRAGFIVVGIGFLLNVRFGSSPAHYGMTIAGALAGAAIATRQVLLHIVPGSGAYGSALFGVHLYTWALAAFATTILYVACLLFLESRAVRIASGPQNGWLSAVASWLFVILVAANLISVLLECGVGPCDDDPTYYHWLGKPQG